MLTYFIIGFIFSFVTSTASIAFNLIEKSDFSDLFWITVLVFILSVTTWPIVIMAIMSYYTAKYIVRKLGHKS